MGVVAGTFLRAAAAKRIIAVCNLINGHPYAYAEITRKF
jgi:hypothetical protein